MSLDFTASTSRRALIVGMTNTDQTPTWQARAPAAATVPDNAERLDDAGGGGDAGGGDGGDINEETGLNAAEQAEFDRMASGDPAPAPGDAPGDDLDGDGDGDGDADGTDPAPAAPPVAGEKTPAELATTPPQGQKPKTINFNRHQRELKAANDARIAAEATATKAREDAIKLSERVAIINEALSAQPAATPAVDPNAPPANPFDEEDIDPNVDYAESVKQIQRRQRFQQENQGRIEQDFTESREDQEMRSTFTRDFQAYAGTEQGKDLPQAYQFLKDSRLTEICISEFDKDPNDPNEQFTKDEVAKMVQMFNNEEKWVVGTAISKNKSPAAAIMKLARARGFKPAAAAPAPRPAAGAAPAPAARAAVPAVRPAPAAVPSAAAELAALATNVQNGRSLSDGGGAPPQGLTAEILLNMSAEEFEEMIDTLPTHQLNTLMGRDAG